MIPKFKQFRYGSLTLIKCDLGFIRNAFDWNDIRFFKENGLNPESIIFPITAKQVNKAFDDINKADNDTKIVIARDFAQQLAHYGYPMIGDNQLDIFDAEKLEYIVYGAAKGIPFEKYESSFDYKLGEQILTQEYKRPTIVARLSNGMFAASYCSNPLKIELYHNDGKVFGTNDYYFDKRNVLKNDVNLYERFRTACFMLDVELECNHEMFRYIKLSPLASKIVNLVEKM